MAGGGEYYWKRNSLLHLQWKNIRLFKRVQEDLEFFSADFKWGGFWPAEDFSTNDIFWCSCYGELIWYRNVFTIRDALYLSFFSLPPVPFLYPTSIPRNDLRVRFGLSPTYVRSQIYIHIEQCICAFICPMVQTWDRWSWSNET